MNEIVHTTSDQLGIAGISPVYFRDLETMLTDAQSLNSKLKCISMAHIHEQWNAVL